MNPYLPPDEEDLDNPYAPPRSTFLPAPAPPRFGGIPFTVSDVFNWSWSFFKERTWSCISIFWGMVGVNYAFNFGMQILLRGLIAAVREPGFFLFLNVIIVLVSLVVQVWLEIGLNRGLLKIARHEPVSFDVIFSGGKSLGATLLAGIVVSMIIAAPAFILGMGLVALFLSMQRMEPLIAGLLFVVGGGLGVVLLVYLNARLMQFYYLVIDRNLGVLESIEWSWRLTKDRVSTIILVYLVQICVFMAGILACCVGLIFAWPLFDLIRVVTYLALTEPARAAGTTPPVAWEEER
ncbi:MAG: hypothetical protein ACHRXM_06845 [Isosphaerales bacterium]